MHHGSVNSSPRILYLLLHKAIVSIEGAARRDIESTQRARENTRSS